MKTKDELKDIFKGINQLNDPIDFEHSILESIRNQELQKEQIKKLKERGIRGLILSLTLIVILGVLYSFQGEFQSQECQNIKYSSIVIALFVLFMQLEMGGFKHIINFKNNTL